MTKKKQHQKSRTGRTLDYAVHPLTIAALVFALILYLSAVGLPNLATAFLIMMWTIAVVVPYIVGWLKNDV